MRIFAEYRSKKNKSFDHVEMQYSVLHFMSGNPRWFCRIWAKDWVKIKGNYFGESYGKNKFEAYRKALNNLKS